ncbi:MAG: DUF29 domain-containing protein [Pseudomonadota bacterium]|nr:DUF29 domain-containing protein [Pseudomonadota bacterium]
MSGYEDDILTWSEQQAALLRRLGAGERINDTDLDWLNLAEEIEGLGRSEIRATESLIIQALAHRMKAEAWPDAKLPVARWLLDAQLFRAEARRAYVPSMRQRIDMEALYKRALRWLPPMVEGQPPLPLPTKCPVTLEELLQEE